MQNEVHRLNALTVRRNWEEDVVTVALVKRVRCRKETCEERSRDEDVKHKSVLPILVIVEPAGQGALHIEK